MYLNYLLANMNELLLLAAISVGVIFLCVFLLHRRLKVVEADINDAEDLSVEETEAIRQAFFSATFALMGHIAKADGKVQRSQITYAENVMQRMNLNAEMRATAIDLFNLGKQGNFNLKRHTNRFRDACINSTGLYRVFMELQIQTALVDGAMAPEEKGILSYLANALDIGKREYSQLEMMVRVSLGVGDDHARRYKDQSGGIPAKRKAGAIEPVSSITNEAYVLLGIPSNADEALTKQAYRRMMNQHHPDKLIAKGVPEGMLSLATDKTRQIQDAYEQIKRAKGWK